MASELGCAPLSRVESALCFFFFKAEDGIRDLIVTGFQTCALPIFAAMALLPPPPADGLVLSYDMETLLANGHMEDLSGQGHHGTMSGTTDVAGKVGRARHFNAGDRIMAPPIRSEELTSELQSRSDF